MVTAGARPGDESGGDRTLVVNTGYRNPALLARMADTLTKLSEGRLILGLGAGDFESEHVAFGYPLGTARRAIRGGSEDHRPDAAREKVTFEGEFYTTREAENIPRVRGRRGPRS